MDFKICMDRLRLERSIKHYSNFHQILLVGEGDFSFSLALANAFGSAENMVTTSLDNKDKVLQLYKSAHETLSNLEKLGAKVLFGVDATVMKKHHIIRKMRFHRIVFNFPHAGFYGRESAETVIKKHRSLLKMFFMNARTILHEIGEIHVSHKEGDPYKKWELVKQAEECGLFLKESVPFTVVDYPGYTNRKGSGRNAGRTFPLGECRTYKFILGPENFMKEIIAGEMERAISETLFNWLKMHVPEEIYKSDELKQLAHKHHQMEKIETSLKKVTLELKSERRAREAAEIAQADSEMTLKDLKVKLNKELNRKDELMKQRDETFLQTEEALRLQVDAVKQRDKNVWNWKVVSFVFAFALYLSFSIINLKSASTACTAAPPKAFWI